MRVVLCVERKTITSQEAGSVSTKSRRRGPPGATPAQISISRRARKRRRPGRLTPTKRLRKEGRAGGGGGGRERAAGRVSQEDTEVGGRGGRRWVPRIALALYRSWSGRSCVTCSARRKQPWYRSARGRRRSPAPAGSSLLRRPGGFAAGRAPPDDAGAHGELVRELTPKKRLRGRGGGARARARKGGGGSVSRLDQRAGGRALWESTTLPLRASPRGAGRDGAHSPDDH